MVADQVGQHFGVSRGLKYMAGLLKPLLERFEILNHAVVNDGDAPALVQVRMGVFVGGRAVGGPAGVADAEAPRQRAALQKLRQALINLALLLLNVQGPAVDHGHSGAVVTSVFEPAQALHQDRPRLALADIAYNSAHNSVTISGCFNVRQIQCHVKNPFRSRGQIIHCHRLLQFLA